MDISPLNIVILPDEETGKIALELSREVNEKFPGFFTLDNKNYFAHITLLQVQYPAEKVEMLIQALEGLTSRIEAFEIKMQGFESVNNGFISWLCKKDEKLQKLHEEIVGLLDLKEYAFSLILDQFNPHITLTRAKEERDFPEIVQFLKETKEEKSFQASKITLGVLGEHGTVNKIIAEFPFKS